MKLDRFNCFGKFIDFDPNIPHWSESDGANDTSPPSGVGDLLAGTCVAVVPINGRLYLYVGQKKFDLGGEGLKLNYEHHEDGTTTFEVRDGALSAKLNYPSWWVQSGSPVVGFGSSDDEDEDICAYISFMASNNLRSQHLIQKYS